MKLTAMALEECGTWSNSSPAIVRMGGRRIVRYPMTNLWNLPSLVSSTNRPGTSVRRAFSLGRIRKNRYLVRMSCRFPKGGNADGAALHR